MQGTAEPGLILVILVDVDIEVLTQAGKVIELLAVANDAFLNVIRLIGLCRYLFVCVFTTAGLLILFFG